MAKRFHLALFLSLSIRYFNKIVKFQNKEARRTLYTKIYLKSEK